MKWLVSAQAGASMTEVAARLRELGCSEVDVDAAVPMGSDEVVVPVEGPKELPALIAGDPMLVGAFNNSDVTLYE